MGLDMYVYRVEKPRLDPKVVYDYSDLPDIVIPESDIHEPAYRELLPYCERVIATGHYYDLDKLAAENELTEVCLSSIIRGVISFSGKNSQGERINISKTHDEIKENYTINKDEPYYVCHATDIHYWRKAYDIQDWFYDRIGNIENTGFYILSAELLRDFNRAFPDEHLPVEDPNEKYAYFYYEWY